MPGDHYDAMQALLELVYSPLDASNVNRGKKKAIKAQLNRLRAMERTGQCSESTLFRNLVRINGKWQRVKRTLPFYRTKGKTHLKQEELTNLYEEYESIDTLVRLCRIIQPVSKETIRVHRVYKREALFTMFDSLSGSIKSTMVQK